MLKFDSFKTILWRFHFHVGLPWGDILREEICCFILLETETLWVSPWSVIDPSEIQKLYKIMTIFATSFSFQITYEYFLFSYVLHNYPTFPSNVSEVPETWRQINFGDTSTGIPFCRYSNGSLKRHCACAISMLIPSIGQETIYICSQRETALYAYF